MILPNFETLYKFKKKTAGKGGKRQSLSMEVFFFGIALVFTNITTTPNISYIKKIFSDKYLKGDSFYMKLNKKLIEFRIIRKICNKLKIDPIFILIVCLIPLIILLFVYFTITTTMIAIIYPLYKSFKALEKKKVIINIKLEEQETTRWLSYWLMYAFINNMECIFWKFLEKIQFYNN